MLKKIWISDPFNVKKRRDERCAFLPFIALQLSVFNEFSHFRIKVITRNRLLLYFLFVINSLQSNNFKINKAMNVIFSGIFIYVHTKERKIKKHKTKRQNLPEEKVRLNEINQQEGVPAWLSMLPQGCSFCFQIFCTSPF